MKNADVSQDDKLIIKEWKHSFEEDTDGIKVYRPSTYTFPPSRGRGGIVFSKNKTCVFNEIAPTDGIASKSGKWKKVSKQEILITFENKSTLSLQILSLTKDKMTVKSF